ncbi:MAG: hypothetical protein J6K86_03265 [Clostridia bacterium]|nr:hypothetical protein [Clostridia bacterium]
MAKSGAVVYEYYKNEFAERCGKGTLCGWFVLFLSGYDLKIKIFLPV